MMLDAISHTLAEERSIALHHEVGRRLREDPSLLDIARGRVRQWLVDGSVASDYAQAWDRILSQPLDEVVQAIVDPSQRSRDLRQCSPFAGTIDPRTRWRILRQVTHRGRA